MTSSRAPGARSASGAIGHAGTLDPFATGLVILLVGRATRLARYLAPLPKTYEVVARLGARSITGDPEGEIVETGASPRDARAAARRRAPAPAGLLGGQDRRRARLRAGPARRGGRDRRARGDGPRGRELRWREGDRAGLRFVCSSGTYVRSLVEALGGDAYCLELRRTAIGPFAAARRLAGQGPAQRARDRRGLGALRRARRARRGAEAARRPPAARSTARGARAGAPRRRRRASARGRERARRRAARRGRPARRRAHGRPRARCNHLGFAAHAPDSRSPTRARRRARSRSAPSTASTSATAR